MNNEQLEYLKDQIKQKLTVGQIIDFYIGASKGRNNRYKCPFNSEEAKCNLEVGKKSWRCFSCGETGDEIDFVKRFFNYKSAIDAINRIAIDFNLDTKVEFDKDYIKKIEKEKALRELEKVKEKEYKKYVSDIYNKVLERNQSLESEIKILSPYSKRNMEKYSYLREPMICIKKIKQYKNNEVLLNILCGLDIEEEYCYMFGYALTREDYEVRKKNVVEMIKNGIIKITSKGDVIYG